MSRDAGQAVCPCTRESSRLPSDRARSGNVHGSGHLVIRSYPYRLADPFRSLRDRGCFPARYSCESRFPQCRSPRWHPVSPRSIPGRPASSWPSCGISRPDTIRRPGCPPRNAGLWSLSGRAVGLIVRAFVRRQVTYVPAQLSARGESYYQRTSVLRVVGDSSLKEGVKMPNVIDDRGTSTGTDAPASNEQLARQQAISRSSGSAGSGLVPSGPPSAWSFS